MKPSATTWLGENIESMVFDGIWIGEDIGLGQDVFVLASTLLLETDMIRIGTGITPFTIHNLARLARAGLSLHELGKERFVFGTGVGGLQDLKRLGIELEKPVTGLRQAVSTLKNLWAGETVTICGEVFKLSNYSLELKKPIRIPIFLGVRGPQMLKLAGEIADGIILSGPMEYIKYAVNILNESAREHGRNTKDIEKVVWLPTIPTFSGVKETLARRIVALIIADTPQKIVDLLAVDGERINHIRRKVRDSGAKSAIDLVDENLLDMFAITGDSVHMVDMFEKLIELGTTEVVLGPPFSGNWREAMHEISNEIASRRSSS